MTEQMSLPYVQQGQRSSGWSGSDTSRNRARVNDSTGITSKRQAETISAMRVRRYDGITTPELIDVLNFTNDGKPVHHGSASGVLSNLHKTERVCRLVDTRFGCKIYVLPEYVYDRTTEKQGRNA